MSFLAQLVALVEASLVASLILGWAHRGDMTPCAALEALDMLEPLFFLLQLELFFIGATIFKMSHFMALEAHEMRELLLFLLLHLSFISS